MHSTLAINIGGSTVKWAWFTAAPTAPVSAQTMPTPMMRGGFHDFLADMACPGMRQPDRVCIGFPGPVDAHGRVSSACTWAPGENLGDFDIAAEVGRVWPQARTSVINDVSAYGCFLLRERYQDFCVLNIGSGIGSKLYAGGRQLLGPGSRGGEIGHWVDATVPAELRCDCGGAQHIGGMSSGRGVLRYVQLQAQLHPEQYARSRLSLAAPQPAQLTAFDIVATVQDPFTRSLVAQALAPLARAAALIHLASGCECFVLVGGFAEALGQLLPAVLAESSAAHCWANGFDWQGAYSVLPNEVSASLIGLYWHEAQHDHA